ncbi:STAS domain-containing protein [Planococcus sp. 1R117A]|uniref:STAS domain-containing protein n=1 Tax=Planococcus sp. 1R117A TaxID=3447020 RepID=UPI003EDBBCBD
MAFAETKKAGSFKSFDDAAEQILKLLSQQLEINTLFIAKNDGQTNEIIKALNAGDELVVQGSLSPLEQTFCNLSIGFGKEPLVIKDISSNVRANKLEIAPRFGSGSFIGIPILYESGEVYGTICGLDQVPFEFTEEHEQAFATMSSLLTYVLELAKANEQIQSLSSPLVPVTQGVAILPVIGEVTAERAQTIIDHVLQKCGENALDYLVIDVSGVSQINAVVGEYLLKLVNILKIIGVIPVITGIQPFMALKVPHFATALKGIMMEANLEMALKQLGFVLIKECDKKTSR